MREENKKTSDLVEGGLGVAAGGHGHAGFYRSGGPRELSTSFDFFFFTGPPMSQRDYHIRPCLFSCLYLLTTQRQE